jgi:hypothetical protein
MAFRKGQSGNPGGRPKKGLSLTDILRELGEVADVAMNGEKIERKQALSEAIWKKAITEGDFQCAKFIFERLDGMPKIKQELTGLDGERLVPDKITIEILK